MIDKRVLDILLLGYKEGQYTHEEVVNKILTSDNCNYAVTPTAAPKCSICGDNKTKTITLCFEHFQRFKDIQEYFA